MGVREKPGRGWVAEIYVPGTGKYLTRSAKTQREARALFAELTVAVAAGREKPSAGQTLADVLAAYLEHVEDAASPTTRYGYGLVIKRLPATLTGLRLRQLTPEKLDAYYRSLRKQHYSDRSVRNVHALIRASLNLAVKRGWIGSNPALRATPGRSGGPQGRVATLAEIEALLAAADPDLRLAIRLAVVTGARRSELAALEWPDIDWAGGTLTISRALVDAGGRTHQKTTKTHQARTIPVDSGTLELLRARRGIAGSVLGKPPRVLSHDLAALCRELGVEGLGWHGFRHAMATLLLGSHDVKTVSARLGHANPNVTLATYAHQVHERDRAAGDAIGAMLG